MVLDEVVDGGFEFTDWADYRASVSAWRVRWRPLTTGSPAILYVAATCPTCQGVRGFLDRRSPVGLIGVASENGQMARDDYETRRERQRQGVQLAKAAGKYTGRAPDTTVNQTIIALRAAGHSIHKTAALNSCSPSQVKRIWAIHLAMKPKHAE